MRFLKTGRIYKVRRITGSQENILGISFLKPNNSETIIEVVKWDFDKIDRREIPTSKEELLEQVLSGLKSINRVIGTTYKVSKTYFSPFENSANQVYSALTVFLIRDYHNQNEFEEVSALRF